MARIILITGGQRSGKSEFAEKMALKLSDTPLYLATAQVFDAEMAARVKKHQARRGAQWSTIEEPLFIGRHDYSGKTVLVDCLTLWASNCLFENQEDIDKSFAFAKTELDKLSVQDATFVFVTNEIGLGGVSENALQRKFTDLQGYVNQYVASKANEAYLIISGISLKIK